MKLRDIPYKQINASLYKWDLSLGLYISFNNATTILPGRWLCESNIPGLNGTIIEGLTMEERFQKVKAILVTNFYFLLKY
jgi:hypothetical protein